MFASANLYLNRSYKRLSRRAEAALKSLPTFGGTRTVIWAACGLLLVALVYLAQASNAALIAHNLHLKENQIQQLEMENAQLRYEIANATSPAAIQERAKKLGLGPATHVVYVTLPALGEDDSLGVVNLPARAPDTPVQSDTVASTTVWDQLLSLFGFGGTNRAEAQGQ